MDGTTKYIFSTGDLIQKDLSICLDNGTNNLYLPVQNLKELYCFNDITLTTKLLQLFSKSGIIIHFFGYYENYIGTFYPKDSLLCGDLTVKQALAFTNNRLEIAKAFVKGIARNIHFVLYHYYRHGVTELKNFLDYLKNDSEKQIDSAKDINELMCIEGSIWTGFYNTFSLFLPEDFVLNKRVRRPPDNPINALISFGNTLLYTKTISQIYETHLNQTISFLHEPSERRFSLSLDLSEPFKPILVFRTIFDCVNNHKLTVEKHFDKKLNYALLNEEGRKIFIEEFENRLSETFDHPTLKRRVSYKQAIKLDAYKLIKLILENTPFETFDMEKQK